jgi:hypothetical protein
MARRRHKNDTRTFVELTQPQRSWSLNATEQYVFKAMTRFINDDPLRAQAKQKCLDRLDRLINRVRAIP